MSLSFHGTNRGGYAGAGNPYAQTAQPYAGPPAQRGVNPQVQNPRHAGSGYPPAPTGNHGPSSAAPMSNDFRSPKLNQVIQRYEINQQYAARLQALGNCEIVILCDDSGSMNAQLQGTNQTRWDELKSLVNIIVEISAVMDSNGVDIYFLNREPLLNVVDARFVHQAFSQPPDGLTPLVPALRRILSAKRTQTYEKKLLILVATDGAPTDSRGQLDIKGLEGLLRYERPPRTYVTFLACTDDLQAVKYLSQWDKSIVDLDVVDDYRSERAEIQRTRGGNFPFTFGDYIVKALLGALDPWFDSLDDRA